MVRRGGESRAGRLSRKSVEHRPPTARRPAISSRQLLWRVPFRGANFTALTIGIGRVAGAAIDAAGNIGSGYLLRPPNEFAARRSMSA